MRTRLRALLADLLDVPESVLTDSIGRDTLAEWTSLAHLQVINAVEDEYSVTLTTAEIAEATSVGRLDAILRDRGVSW